MSTASTEILPAEETTVFGAGYFPEIPLLAQTEVLLEREGGLYECYVPKELIDHEEVPVKEDYVKSLARQMRQEAAENGGSGQQTPIRLGWIEGESVFRIIDGFHRDAGLVENNEPRIYATVKRVDWDTLYDERIVTAKDHTNVRFSRVVKWMHEVWEHSGMAEDLTVEQAILLYRFDTNGSKLGLDSEVTQRAKDWVARKELIWDMAAMTIHNYLQTAESVDPVLVNATRDRRGGSSSLEAPNQQFIKTLSKLIPNKFALQNLVWEQTKQHDLKGPQINALCLLIGDLDTEEAISVINEIDVANIKPVHQESQDRALRRAADPRHKGATALQAATIEIGRVNQRVQQSLDRGEPVDVGMIEKLNQTINHARALQAELGKLAANIALLKDSNKAHVPITSEINQHAIERVYARHNDLTARNAGREPLKRSTRSIAAELPTFGRFSNEDWRSLEPYHRFALMLDHPDITSQDCSPSILFSKVLELSKLPDDKVGLDTNIQHLVKLLTSNAPHAIYPIIIHETATGKVVLTQPGINYLKEVVNNTLLAVDDAKSETESE